MSMIDVNEIKATARQIEPYIVHTPAVDSPGVSELLGVPVTLKLDTLQRTGSFKSRGAAAKLLTLSSQERSQGVIAVSGGNHATAVAVMANVMQVEATVVMPQSASPKAAADAEAAGAKVITTDTTSAAFDMAERFAAEGLVMIHPFDDPIVVAGQGTVGLELAEDAPDLTDVLVSVGGGGLIAGVATAMIAANPDIRVWGVEVEGADAMSQALALRKPTLVNLTSIVSTLSAPTVSTLTYDHAKNMVRGVKVMSDADAVRGAIEFAEHAKIWAEPAAGCLVPAAQQLIDESSDSHLRLGLIVCGGNVTIRDICNWADRFGFE
jgi:threonine dehydratase